MTLLTCTGILFDNDGVLVDSDASVTRAWTRWARAYGFEPADVLPIVRGRRSADTVRLLIAEHERAEALAMADRLELDDGAHVTAIPGARDLLTSLPRDRWAVVTSAVTDLATARLASALLPDPPVLVTAEDVSAGKPDPAGYLAAAARLGIDAADAIVIEDSPAGIQAGRAAGVRHVIGVGERALATDADVVIHDLRSLTWTGAGLTVGDAIRGTPRIGGDR